MDKLYKTVEWDFKKWVAFVKNKKLVPAGSTKVEWVIIEDIDSIGVEKDKESGKSQNWVKGKRKPVGGSAVPFFAVLPLKDRQGNLLPQDQQPVSSGVCIESYFKARGMTTVIYWAEPSEIQKDIEYFNSIKGIRGVMGSAVGDSAEVEFYDRNPVTGQVKFRVYKTDSEELLTEGEDFLIRPDYPFVDFMKYGFTPNTPEAIKSRIELNLKKISEKYPKGLEIIDGVRAFTVIEAIYNQDMKKYGLRLAKEGTGDTVDKFFSPGTSELPGNVAIGLDSMSIDLKSKNRNQSAKMMTMALKKAGIPVDYTDIYWDNRKLKLDIILTDNPTEDSIKKLDDEVSKIERVYRDSVLGNQITYIITDKSKETEESLIKNRIKSIVETNLLK